MFFRKPKARIDQVLEVVDRCGPISLYQVWEKLHEWGLRASVATVMDHLDRLSGLGEIEAFWVARIPDDGGPRRRIYRMRGRQ